MTRVVFYYTDGEEAGIDIENIHPPAVGTKVELDILNAHDPENIERIEETCVVKEVRLGIQGRWKPIRHAPRDEEWRLSAWYEVYLERE
jgi:hypothetical protein